METKQAIKLYETGNFKMIFNGWIKPHTTTPTFMSAPGNRGDLVHMTVKHALHIFQERVEVHGNPDECRLSHDKRKQVTSIQRCTRFDSPLRV